MSSVLLAGGFGVGRQSSHSTHRCALGMAAECSSSRGADGHAPSLRSDSEPTVVPKGNFFWERTPSPSPERFCTDSTGRIGPGILVYYPQFDPLIHATSLNLQCEPGFGCSWREIQVSLQDAHQSAPQHQSRSWLPVNHRRQSRHPKDSWRERVEAPPLCHHRMEPCKFAFRPRGCKDGAMCTHCHDCPYTRAHRPRGTAWSSRENPGSASPIAESLRQARTANSAQEQEM